VALISLAVALPVGIFVGSAFELANDSEAPESWLAWSGAPRMLLGRGANRRWHWTGARGPPSRFVRWWCRCADAPKVETLLNGWLALWAWVTGGKPFWVVEAEEAAAAAAAYEPSGDDDDKHAPSEASSGASSAAALLVKKRAYTVLGLGTVAACWVIFSWIIFTCALLPFIVACSPCLR
jgi:hypothetical protein